MTTPHAVGQNAKARMLVAHVLEKAPAGVDHDTIAAKVVEQLQGIGWTPPIDMTAPPARPADIADEDSPGRQAFRAAKAALAARPRNTPFTASACQTPDATLDSTHQVTPDLERSNP